MAEILGSKYRNAEPAEPSGEGWAVSDKIFSYLDKAGDIYNKVRWPQPGDPDYIEAEARLRAEKAGIMGLPKPWGALILMGGAGLIGWVIYKIATK